MPVFTFGLIIFIWALWCLRKLPRKRIWAVTLLAPAVLTIGLFAYTLHELHRTSCGRAFDPDLGCVNSMPNWVIPAGLVAGLITLIAAVAIIVASRKQGSESKEQQSTR